MNDAQEAAFVKEMGEMSQIADQYPNGAPKSIAACRKLAKYENTPIKS